MTEDVSLLRAPRRAAALAAFVLLAGCTAVPRAEPPPPPPPAPAPPPPPPVVQPTLPWEEAPVAAGDWSYTQGSGQTIARFGAGGDSALVAFSCNQAAKTISITRSVPAGGATSLTIRTSSGALSWAGASATNGLVVTRPASDPGFDWIAFSRGRISIETAGAPRLIVPAWAEISRVIEDCRN